MASGRALVINKLDESQSSELFHALQRDPLIRSYIGCPLISNSGQSLGTLSVFDRAHRSIYADQIELLNTIAKQIAYLYDYQSSMQALMGKADQLEKQCNSLTTQLSETMKYVKVRQRPDKTIVEKKDALKKWKICDLPKIGCLERIELQTFTNWDEIRSQLTLTELKILSTLEDSFPLPVSREEFSKSIWKSIRVNENVLDVHLHSLRKKLCRHRLEIKSVGKGKWCLSIPHKKSGTEQVLTSSF